MNDDYKTKERIKNMLRVSDYMLGRVVDEAMKDETTPLYYDIIAECQCRDENGKLIGWDYEHNCYKTPFDRKADLVINKSCGEILDKL